MSLLAAIKGCKAAEVAFAFAKKGCVLAQAHAPALWMGTGITCMAVGTVVGIYKAMDLKDVLEENIHYMEVLKEARIGETLPNGTVVTKEHVNKLITVNYMQICGKLVRTFAPVIALEVLGAACVIQGHHILMTRAAAMAAAMATMQKQFDGFYDRVVDKVGLEEASNLRYGIKKELVQETIIDENGNEVVQTKEVETFNLDDVSMYALEFNADTSYACTKSAIQNQTLFASAELAANRQLKRDGMIFLTDIRKLLHMRGPIATQMSQRAGWYLKNPNGTDGEVKFIFKEIPFNRTALNGGEQRYIIDFNVDGDIMSLI